MEESEGDSKPDARPVAETRTRPGGAAALGLSLLLIGLWGCLSIYNAKAFGEYPLHFALRQAGWLALGVGSFLLASRIPFAIYRAFAQALAGAALAALAVTLLFGTTVNGMKGWLQLPLGLPLIQPSEFAKIPFLLQLSVMAADEKMPWSKRFLRMGLLSLAFVLLIGVEPDFGMATMYFIGFLCIYWIAGGAMLLGLLSLGIFATLATLFLLRNDYAMLRIVGYLNPNADALGYGWHIKQFQYTLAHGGLLGSNWGNALWSNAFLPLAHSDSVFASIVESAGFAGGALVICGFIAMAFAAYCMADKAKEKDAKVFIFGTGAFLCIQALLHISVNTTLIPPTGITLPILSYGGSSMISTMLAFGVAFSAFRESK